MNSCELVFFQILEYIWKRTSEYLEATGKKNQMRMAFLKLGYAKQSRQCSDEVNSD